MDGPAARLAGVGDELAAGLPVLGHHDVGANLFGPGKGRVGRGHPRIDRRADHRVPAQFGRSAVQAVPTKPVTASGSGTSNAVTKGSTTFACRHAARTPPTGHFTAELSRRFSRLEGSTLSTTANIYSHLTQQAAREAVDTIEHTLTRAEQKTHRQARLKGLRSPALQERKKPPSLKRENDLRPALSWSGRQDLNLRPLDPQLRSH